MSHTYFATNMGAADGTLYVRKLDAFGSFYNVRNIAALNGADGSTKWILAPNLYKRPNGGVTQTSGYYTFQFVGSDGTVYATNSSPTPSGSVTVEAIR